MNKFRPRSIALIAVAASALAACSSSGNASSSSTASPSAAMTSASSSSSVAQPNQTSAQSGAASAGSNSSGPIKIAMITSLSGQYSTLGQFGQKTVELLVSQLNAAGGIDGRNVEVTYADDQTSPTQAVVALNNAAAQHPVAIIGPVLSTACSALADKVDALKIPMVTTCATDSQVNPIRPYDFMATLPTPGMTQALANYLKSEGKTKVGLLYDSGDFGQSGLQWITKQGTVDVVAKASYNLSATTFVSQLTAVLSKNPQAVIVWGAGPPLVTIAKEFKQLGAKVPLLYSGAAATPLFVGPAGSAGDGIIMASSVANVVGSAPDSNPSKAIDEKLAQDYQAKYGQPMSQFTADACGAWKVIINAIQKAGTDPTKVRDAIESTPAVGCHGTYNYSATDHRGLNDKDVWVVTDENGKLVSTPFSVNQNK